MARIVLTTFGSYGDLHPYLALGRALSARGHDVAVATSQSYRAKVETQRLRFHPVRPDLHDFGLFSETVRRAYEPRRGAEYIVRELLMPSLADSFDDLHTAVQGADLLVTHALSYAGHLLGRSLTAPWVSTILSPMLFLSIHEPPPLPPATWLRPLHRLSPSLYRLVLCGLKASTRSWSAPVRKFCRDRGLPAPDCNPLFEGQFSPLMTLAMFSPLLAQPQPDWPPNTHITGFAPHDAEDADAAVLLALDTFLAAGEPPIVFTLGSSAIHDAGDFYWQAAAIAQQLGVRAVLLTGEGVACGRLLSTPAIHVAEYVPYARIFPRAAAIVHQGGIGTLAQAMYAGRPMLVVPFSHDQPDNAERAERLGIAKRISRARFSVRSAAAALRELLQNERYIANAREIASRLRAEDGTAAACDRLEAVLR